MLKINLSSPVPIYEQIIEEIKKMIRVGELKTGDSLPPIRTLAKQLDIAANTVARAYQELENLDLVEGNRRKGSFVKKQITEIDEDLSKIFKEPIIKLLQQGLNKSEIEMLFNQNINQIFD
ncbi:GntR family transcriptional regulator [Bacteroidota bacterium]